MSKTDQEYDEDLEKIMNEVGDFDIEEDDEEGYLEKGNENLNVEDILNEDLGDQTNSLMTDFESSQLTITELAGPRLELNDLSNSSEHPLSVVEKFERDISARLGSQMNLESKFLVTNYEKHNSKSYSNVNYMVIESISEHCFPDEHNALPSHNDWGTPKCLAIYSEKYIALGTSHSVALVFDYKQSEVKRLGTAKEQEYGPITTMDIIPKDKDELLLCGYESGHITLWSLMKTSLLNVIAPTDKGPVLSVKFWKEDSFIGSNSKGIVYLYKVEAVFFKLKTEITKKVLLDLSTSDKKKSDGLNPLDALPDGFFSIQFLKKDLVKNHPINSNTIVALASMKMVLVLTLEPSVDMVYRFNRPSGLLDPMIPSLSWGKGAIPGHENNKHPLLAVSWGYEINLFSFIKVEEEATKGLKHVGFYRSNAEICHVEWISESSLLTFDYSKEFKVLLTGGFNPNFSEEKERENFDYSAAVINAQLFDTDISFQIYKNEKTSKFEAASGRHQRPILYFTNTIAGNIFARSIFAISSKKMYIGRHFEWKEYIESLVENVEWLQALSLFTSLAKGTNKMFAGLPTKTHDRQLLLKEYGAELIKSYIMSTYKVEGGQRLNPGNNIWKTVTLIVIDFLVSIENFIFLFQEVKLIYEKFGLQSLYMECLEPFILKNRIKYIPNEPFRDIVNYYSEKDKVSVLQYLMINLEMHDLDLDFAISLCMDYNLLTALLYLCSHKSGVEGPDFMTPIARALSLYQKSIEEDHAENQEYGIKFLWFVNMTIKGRMFPHGAIPELIWEEKVRDLIVLIFEEAHLELMLRIEPHVAFETLRTLFEPKLAMLINSFDENSIQLIADRNRPNRKHKNSMSALGATIEQFKISMDNKIQAQMLALIYYCGKKPRSGMDYKNLTYYMISSLVASLGYKVPDGVTWECLFYVLEHDRHIPKWEMISKRYDEKDIEKEGDPLIEERNQLALELLKQLEGKIQEEDLETVRRMTDHTGFIDVKVYLFALKRDYNKCLDLYLGQSTYFQLMKTFKWLDEIIENVRVKQPANFKNLKDVIVSRLPDLVRINSERTRRVLINLGQTSEGDAIKLLEGSPNLQLEFLNGVLAQAEEAEDEDEHEEVPEDLLVLHIKLLCQLKPKQVAEEVRKRRYPVDPCLRICREYNVKGGLAFFLEKAGDNLEALELLLDVFQEALLKKVKKIEQKSLFDERNLDQKIGSIKELCLKHSTIGNPETEKLWFKVLDRLLEVYRANIVNNKTVQQALKSSRVPHYEAYRRFVNIYSEYISDMFDKMSRNVHVESIIRKLKDYKDLKLRDLRPSLMRMLEGYNFESTILKDSTDLIVEDNYENTVELYNKASKGTLTGRADIDTDLIDAIVIFDCSHSFPKSYVHGDYCPICSKNQSQKALNLLANSKRGLQRSVLDASTASASVLNPEVQNEEGEPPMNAQAYAQNLKDEKRERMLRKLMIMEHKREDAAGDWDDLGNSNHIF